MEIAQAAAEWGINKTAASYKINNIENSSPKQFTDFIEAKEHHIGKMQKKYHPVHLGDVPRTEADVTDLVENL